MRAIFHPRDTITRTLSSDGFSEHEVGAMSLISAVSEETGFKQNNVCN